MQREAQTLSVTIKNFCPKGYGIASLPSGKEIEVAHSVPGDQLLLEWKKKKSPPQKGRLLEILSPAKDRVEPRCAHAKVCGGCSWQQVSYEAQLREKERRVRAAFKDRYPVDPIVAAPVTFGYRNKMEFTFSENRGGQKYFGFMIAQAEPYVFNLTECHLGPPWFAEAVQEVRAWWEASQISAFRLKDGEGALRYLTLRHGMRTDQKMAILNVSGNPAYALKRADLEGFVSAIQKAVKGDVSIFLRIHQTQKGTPTQFFEMHLAGADHILEELHLQTGKLALKVSPSSFFQPNPSQAEKLYDLALEAIPPSSIVFDLYCGTGTLTMAAAKKAKRVVGIELSPEAVLDAEENMRRNGLENGQIHQGDVGKVLTRLMAQSDFERPDVLLLDPPRAGLDPLALHHVKTLLPKAIIYISCNPLTQAENCEELLRAGYRLERLQPLDQFPHTYHIENIAFLAR